jgi:hypothetical protein
MANPTETNKGKNVLGAKTANAQREKIRTSDVYPVSTIYSFTNPFCLSFVR